MNLCKRIVLGICAALICSLPMTPPASAIVGGTPAAEGEFPYMLSLQRKGWGGSWAHSCGAVLVAPLAAVTAAHCVDGASPSVLRVRSQSLKTSSGGNLSKINEVVVHPNYNSRNLDNDIAVLHLASLGSGLLPALLPAPGSDSTTGTVRTAGWGTTSEGGSLSPTLMQAEMPVVNRMQCRNNYSVTDITDQMICAGEPVGGVGQCVGDAGGPVMDGLVLVGIGSWAFGCAQPNKPDVYVRVGSFVPWILANSLPL